MMTYHVQFLLLVLVGWVNRQQVDVSDLMRRMVKGSLLKSTADRFSLNEPPELAACFANAAKALKCRGMTERAPLPPEKAIHDFAGV